MEENDSIATLEHRLARLERKVYNESDAAAQVKCIDSLVNIHNQLQSAVTGREKITSIFSRLDELQQYLSPEFRENVGLTESCKLNLVLLAEDHIRNVVDALQTVKDLQQYLDSEHVRGTPALIPKFLSLSQVHSELEENVSNISAETKHLFGIYDEIILAISKEFVVWDAILTSLEAKKAKQSKK